MATSPIYGWPEPDNSSLVKNGAQDMRALGDAIDTTMATMIPKSLIAAKGDLVAASANDTPAILSVGNSGETIVADSSTATGLRYTAGTVQANPIINSAAQIWQRGTSIAFNASVGYFADRWYGYCVPAGTFSRQATNDTTNLPFIQYCMRIQRNSGSTNTGNINITQSLETINSIPFVGKTVTMSFYARAGANYSNASNALAAVLITGTGTDQNANAGYTGAVNAVSGTAILTTTWQRFSYTGTIATTANEIAVNYSFTPTGTAGANDYFEITGVQIDIGSVALPFRTYAGTIQGETSACQRYYLKSYNQATAPATASNTVGNFAYSAISTTSTHNRGNVRFPVAMRTTPTITIYSTSTGTSAKIFNEQAAADVDGASQYIGESGFHVYPTSGTPALGNQLLVHYVASAEL